MAEPARKFEPAPEKVELLPPDFKLPDLSPLPPDEYERETKISFDTNINGLDLTMNISFIRLEDAAQPYIMNLEIKGYLPGTKERVTSFKGVINNAARLSWSDQPQKTNNLFSLVRIIFDNTNKNLCRRIVTKVNGIHYFTIDESKSMLSFILRVIAHLDTKLVDTIYSLAIAFHSMFFV